MFGVNTGTLITICSPKSMYIWDYKEGGLPKLAHSLELKRENFSACLLPCGSEWLLVGTEKGNVLFFRSDNFSRSSVDIMWNKAVNKDYSVRCVPNLCTCLPGQGCCC